MSWSLLQWLSSKEFACNAGDTGSISGWEDLREEEMATHSSILAWKIQWTEEPGYLQSMELKKSWTWLCAYAHIHTPLLSLSIQAAITVSQTESFLMNKFISHCSVGWKFKIRVPAWSCSGEDSLPGCILLSSCCVLKLGWPQSTVAWSRTLVP